MLSSQRLYELCYEFFKIRRLTSDPESVFYSRVLVVDNAYTYVDINDLSEVIRTNPLLHYTDRLLEEINDCDDYALQLKVGMTELCRHRAYSSGQAVYPPAVGLIFTEFHALNLVVTKIDGEDQVFIVDTMMPVPSITQEALQAWDLMKRSEIRQIFM